MIDDFLFGIAGRVPIDVIASSVPIVVRGVSAVGLCLKARGFLRSLCAVAFTALELVIGFAWQGVSSLQCF